MSLCKESGTTKSRQCCRPCALVIFGASGDLAHRKLIPALYNLAAKKLLPDHFAIVGFGRNAADSAEFRSRMNESIKKYATSAIQADVWQWLLDRMHFVTGQYDDAAAYRRLAELLDEVDRDHGTQGNRLFYMATPPGLFEPIARRLSEVGLTQQSESIWRRVIIEKPFGHDLGSARSLNSSLVGILSEDQIYRIDHYLGKETVQNILVFRFGNGIFEPIWNHRYVDHVQITASEEVGVEKRASYYESAGAMRDMVSNHVLQLLALIAMEPPISLDADAIRNEKARVLASLQPFVDDQDIDRRVVRGQYGPSQNGTTTTPAYRDESGVSPQSTTETFVAMKMLVDNWRWSGVPFYLRTGKRLAGRRTEIAIQFKRPPLLLFPEQQSGSLPPNLLTITIQPEEGISLRFGAKIPGPAVKLGNVDMAFNYRDYFGSEPNTGYETLLFDAMCGDQTLFQRADSVELSWKAVDPVLAHWRTLGESSVPAYSSGSWGPTESDTLLECDGRHWKNPG